MKTLIFSLTVLMSGTGFAANTQPVYKVITDDCNDSGFEPFFAAGELVQVDLRASELVVQHVPNNVIPETYPVGREVLKGEGENTVVTGAYLAEGQSYKIQEAVIDDSGVEGPVFRSSQFDFSPGQILITSFSQGEVDRQCKLLAQ